jgi:hypothetical protein
LSTQERWFTDVYDHSEYMIRFRNVSYGSYIVSYRSLTYYFGSVSDVRFVFDRDKIVYDPLSGKLARDHIKILKTNSQPTSNSPLNKDITLNVVGQPLEADGYVDNYAVEIAGFALDTNGTDKNPDFFTDVAGFNIRQLNTRYFTFFKQVIDANMMMRYEMIPTTDVVYDYGTMSDIAVIKYEYPVGQIYFAVLESKFYKSVNDTTSANIVNLVEVSDYGYKYGRQGLYFQYKHISNDTTRIDPATSNIIDIYVLTQDYYTQYRNWIKDNTGKISEPSRPTIRELSNAYNDLSNYKMISDSIIFNSARFKPLFGSKADSKLQATLKVIKASNTNASDSEIRNLIIAEINNYFSIENWNFGDKFYFSELSAYLHSQIGDYISSIVLVPKDPNLKFGDLYEIYSAPYEIFANAAQTDDIVIISALTANELQIAS